MAMFTAHTVLTLADAEYVVAKLMADNEDSWTYKIRHDPKDKRYTVIEVYDEDDIFVGLM